VRRKVERRGELLDGCFRAAAIDVEPAASAPGPQAEPPSSASAFATTIEAASSWCAAVRALPTTASTVASPPSDAARRASMRARLISSSGLSVN
jgi:hypothetical protein